MIITVRMSVHIMARKGKKTGVVGNVKKFFPLS